MAYHLRKKQNPLRIDLSANNGTLFFIAEQKGFFNDHNVKIKLNFVPFGRKGMENMLDGKCDIAALLETNIAYLGYSKNKLPVKTFASIQQRFDNKIILRHNDKDSAKPEDLFGKRIAFQPGTTSHSFLFHFLKTHNIKRSDVTLKTITPQAMPDAIMRGSVDAIVAWNPHTYHASRAMDELDQNYTIFKNSGIYRSEVVLTATKPTIVKHKTQITAMLRALKQAGEFLSHHKEDTLSICAQYMKMPVDALREDYALYGHTLLSVGDTYLKEIEMLGQWIKESDTTYESAEIPSYSDYIDRDFFVEFFDETI